MYSKQYKLSLIVFLIVLLFITQACTDIYIPGLPLMAREFGVTPAKMNLTVSVYVYAQAALFLIMGLVSDLWGRRKTILVSIALATLASFTIAFNHNVNQIILLRIIQALGSGAVYIVSRLIIKEVYDFKEQLRITGLLLIGLILSPALAPVAGAVIINYFGWRTCFSLIGYSLAILTIIGSILLKESNHNIDKFRADFNLISVCSSYFRILVNGLFIRYNLIVGGTFAAFYAFITMSSYMYINEYHIASIYYSYLFVFMALGYLLGNKIMLFLNSSYHIRPYRLVKIGIGVGLIAMSLVIAALFLQHISLIFIGLITLSGLVMRMATAFINPPIQVEITHCFGNNSSLAIGLMSCIQYIFGGFGSWIVGILHTEPSISIIISTILFTLLTSIAFIFLKDQHFS